MSRVLVAVLAITSVVSSAGWHRSVKEAHLESREARRAHDRARSECQLARATRVLELDEALLECREELSSARKVALIPTDM